MNIYFPDMKNAVYDVFSEWTALAVFIVIREFVIQSNNSASICF